jgi:hypothetical protein
MSRLIFFVLILCNIAYSGNSQIDYATDNLSDIQKIINVNDSFTIGLDSKNYSFDKKEEYAYSNGTISYVLESATEYAIISFYKNAASLWLYKPDSTHGFNREGIAFFLEPIDSKIDFLPCSIQDINLKNNSSSKFTMMEDLCEVNNSCAGSSAEIGVLVAYEDEVNASSLNTNVANEITFANLTNSNSGLSHTFDLRAVILADHEFENRNAEEIWDDLKYNNGILDFLWIEKVNYDADLLAYVVDGFDNGFCGYGSIGWQGAYEGDFDGFTQGVSVTDQACISSFNHTLLHELGHNLGLRHNVEDNISGPALCGLGYGYYSSAEEWRTIMSYPSQCSNGCPEIPHWSNPDINYNGDPTGTSTDNNAFIVDRSACSVSEWASLQDPLFIHSNGVVLTQCETNQINWYASDDIVGSLVAIEYRESGSSTWNWLDTKLAFQSNILNQDFARINTSSFDLRFITVSNGTFTASFNLNLMDPYEPNDLSTQSSVLPADDEIVISAFDDDWFSFNYNADTYYVKAYGFNAIAGRCIGISSSLDVNVITVTTYQTDLIFDSYLELYDNNLNLLAENDDANGTPFAEIIYELEPLSTDLIVNTSNNTDDADPGDGQCLDANGECSLRAAIQEANADPNENIILFESFISEVEITQEITITNPVIIDGGSTGNIMIDGNGAQSNINNISDNVGIYGIWFRNYEAECVHMTDVENINIGMPGKGCVFTESLRGIEINGNSSNIDIKSNYFGTDPSFNLDLGNSAGGVFASSASSLINLTIGGNFNSDESNYFGDNDVGINLNGNNQGQIIGNYFGTNQSQNVNVGNNQSIVLSQGDILIGGSEQNRNVFYYGFNAQIELNNSNTSEVSFNEFYFNTQAITSFGSPRYLYRNSFICNVVSLEDGPGDPKPIIESASTTTIEGTCVNNAIVEVHQYIIDDCPSNTNCEGGEFLGFANVTGTNWTFSGSFNPGDEFTVIQHNPSQETSGFSACMTAESPCDLTGNIQVTSTTCGENNGEIVVSAIGGTAPYQYILNDAITNSIGVFSDLSAGIYDVDIVDADDCVYQEQVEVGESDVMSFSATTTETICGEDDGTLEIFDIVGQAPFSFTIEELNITLDDNILDAFFEGLPSGDYTLIGVDADGCSSILLFTVEMSMALLVDIISSEATCGQDSGAFDIEIISGTEPIMVSVNGGPFTDQLNYNNLSTGTYEVDIVDAEGCNFVEIIEIEGDNMGLEAVASFLPTTCGEDNGEIAVEILNGADPIDYFLNGVFVGTSGQFVNLSSGSYDILAVDVNNCEYVETVSIMSSIAVEALVEVDNASCGENNGQISIFVTSGTPPYNYSIDGGSSFSSEFVYNNLPSMSYPIQVLDNEDCLFEINTEVEEDSEGLSFNSLVEHTTCGNDNGVITLNLVSGLEPIDYFLNGAFVGSFNVFEDLPFGTYNILAIDQNECEFTTSLDVEPSIPLDYFLEYDNTTCGETNGVISFDVDLTSGTSPFQYSIDGGQNFSNNSVWGNLMSDTYLTVVIDANGCGAEIEVELFDSAPLAFEANVMQPTCGEENGIIEIIVTSGTPPYLYDFGSGLQSESIMSNLQYGNYSIIVQDNAMCVSTQDIGLDFTEAPTLSINQIEDASCGQDDGALIVYNSAEAYTGVTYELINQSTGISTTQNNGAFDFLGASTYDLISVDNDGCIVSIEVSIDNIGGPVLIVEHQDASCVEEDGTISIDISGGTGSYEIYLNGELVNETMFDNLPAGTYLIEVGDGNQCSTSETVEIEQGTLDYTIVTNNSAPCIESGVITITVEDGTEVEFVLNGTQSNVTGIFIDLEPGPHTLEIISENCTYSEIIEILADPDISYDLILSHPSCNVDNGIIEFENLSGIAPISFLLNGETESSSGIFNMLSSGVYYISIIDGNNCITPLEIELVAPEVFGLEAITTNENCGMNDGTIQINIVDSTPGMYEYTLEGIITNETGYFENLSEGEFTVEVVNEDDCISTIEVNINNITNLEVEITLENETCSNQNGTILIDVSGGTMPYQYFVNSEEIMSNSISGLQAMDYLLEIVDAIGCTHSEIVDVENENTVNLVIINTTNPSGGEDGVIQVEGIGGVEPYAYSIESEENNTGVFESLNAGEYEVIVTDAEGCSMSIEIELIDNPSSLNVEFIITNSSCANSNGAIECIVEGGTGSYMYQINGGMFQSDNLFSSLGADDYEITIMDDNGSAISEQVTLENEGNIELEYDFVHASCGMNNGSINITIIEGIEPLIYILNGAEIGENDLQNLTVGAYVLQISNSSMCFQVIEFEIMEIGDFTVVPIESHTSCGYGNGSIQLINVDDLNLIYSLNGVTYQEENIFTDLVAGDYTVYVQNTEDECMITLEIMIEDSESLSYTYDCVKPSCSNPLGSIFFDPSLNSEITSISLDGIFFNVGDLITIEQGLHLLIVESENCIATETIEITQEMSEVLSLDESIQLSICGDECNGEVQLELDASVGEDFIVFWPDGPSKELYRNNLCADSYNIIVEYNNGNCTDQIDFIIEASDIYDLAVQVIDANCGQDNGAILLPNGAPYNIEWSDGSDGIFINNLGAEEYSFKIVDAFGCVREESIVIEQLGSIDLNPTIINVSCFSYDDGGIELQLTGSLAPYIVLWEDGSTGLFRNNLSKGTYSVEVRDSTQTCTRNQTFEIFEPQSLDGEFEINSTTVTAEIEGGVPPYNYMWSTGDTTSVISYDEGDTLSVIVTDANNCTLEWSNISTNNINIEETPIKIYPNPFSDNFIIEHSGINIENVLLFSVTGQLVKMDSELINDKIEVKTTGLASGIYLLKMQSEKNVYTKQLILVR